MEAQRCRERCEKGGQTVVEYEPLYEEVVFLEQEDESNDKDTAERAETMAEPELTAATIT